MRDFLLAVFIVFDILTFVLYVTDKLWAVRRKRRIPERVLLTLAIPGGVGAFLAMILARHKIRKWRFILLCTLSSAVQTAYVLQAFA